MPDFPFLADDIVWVELPIIGWIVLTTFVMLVLYARFGWDRTHAIISRRRVWLGVTLAVAVVMAGVFHVLSGQPVRMYL